MRSHGGTGICEVRGSPRQPESSTGSRGHFFVVLGVSQGFSGFTCGFQGLVVVENTTRIGSSKRLSDEYPANMGGISADFHRSVYGCCADLYAVLPGICAAFGRALDRLGRDFGRKMERSPTVLVRSLPVLFSNIKPSFGQY